MSLPATLPNGYLPPGVHAATQREVVDCFGADTPRRQVLASQLQELLGLARATEKLRRAFVWGSFVTTKPFLRDLDVFLLMQEGFDWEFASLPPTQQCVFEHEWARLLFEADVFWGD